MRSFITAGMIAQRLCSPSRDGQELLPHLVEKLITASLPRENLKELRFPHGDEIYLHGGDGVLAVDDGVSHPFIPHGLSLWEMGTSLDPKSKADDDFKNAGKKLGNAFPNVKPAVTPDCATFVFVTSKPWESGEWIKSAHKQSTWRAIRVLDAVALETWLAQCPAVMLWFAKECGLPAEGLFDAEQYLDELGIRFGAPVSPNLVIGGRQEAVDKVRDRALQDRGAFSVAGESVEESAAFVAAVFLNEKEALRDVPPLVLADQRADLALLATHNADITLLLLDTEAAARAKSLKLAGWRTVRPVVVGSHRDTAGDAIALDGVKRAEIEKHLVEVLELPEHKARQMGRDCKGSLVALLWLIGSGPLGVPRWASRKDATTHASLMLLGSWIGDNKNDTAVVETVSQKAYRDIETLLQSALLPEGPWIHRAAEWLCASKDFVWGQLAPKITETMLADFRKTACDVLGEADPSLDLEPSERHMANILGKVRKHSRKLRQGLADSLARLAVARADGQGWADAIVRSLLDPSQPEPELRWLSLVDVYAELAEASPDVFLSMLDEYLAAHATSLFQDSEDSDVMFGPTSAHVYLLWALERLAWNHEWFPRVLGVLARLAQADPGGKTANRPINSLQTILLPWSPQHGEDLSKAAEAMDMLHRATADVAWAVGVKLLPKGWGTTSPTQKPEYRDAPGSRTVTVKEYWEFVRAVVARLIRWAGSDEAKLADLVSAYPQLRRGCDEVSQMVTDALGVVDKSQLTDEGKAIVEASLRQVISHHQAHDDAEWALPRKDIETLDQLRQLFMPSDLVLRHKHLFSWSPHVPNAPMEPHEDGWDEWLAEQQDAAAKAVFDADGVDGLLRLAETVEVPGQVGRAIAANGMEPRMSVHLIRSTCSVAPDQTSQGSLQCGRAYIWAMHRQHGLGWLTELLGATNAKWSHEQLANIALGAPPSPELWIMIDKWDREAHDLYWQYVEVRFSCIQHWQTVLGKWQTIQRPWSSLDLLADVVSERHRDDDVPEPSVDQVMDVLERVLAAGPEVEPRRRDGQMMSYHVEKLFEYIDRGNPNRAKLARLEWGWLRVLQNTKRGARVLQQEVTSSPELFVDLLKILYRAEGEERVEAPDEDKKAMAEQAFHLLHEMKRVPGQDDAGPIDGKRLLDWVVKSRELAAEADRLTVCDIQIGEILSNSPESPDGTWPCREIREILEEVQSPEIERGLHTGKLNQRGVTSRSLTEGGKQEWALAKQFRAYAEKIRMEYPRSATVLDGLASSYEHQARREDEQAKWDEYE